MIYVAPLATPKEGSMSYILRRIPEVFGVPSAPLAPAINLRGSFDDRRMQYNSTSLLLELLKVVPSGNSKLIGITDRDLFIPVLTHVFGEAQLGGSVAVASCHRLRNSFYGLPDDPDTELRRLEKEVFHELGHTFNLKHCNNYSCVMHSSTFVEDIDLKNSEFCPVCFSLLER